MDDLADRIHAYGNHISEQPDDAAAAGFPMVRPLLGVIADRERPQRLSSTDSPLTSQFSRAELDSTVEQVRASSRPTLTP